MANPVVRLPMVQAGFGKTLRRDAWWVGPGVTFAVLTAFIVYATFRAFENNFYQGEALGLPYLSPFYSPFIETKGLGVAFFSPAMLILPGPASFRFTCYYYRKAYYRAFAMDPPACAVGEARHKYNGEKKLLLFQNLHRFTMYVAVLFLLFLWHDFIKSLMWPDGFGMGVGSLVILANCVFLSAYTFSCHSWRHLIGGSVNSFSTEPLGGLRHALWSLTSKLNERHMQFAWVSLFGVALTDFYVRQVASGAIHDIRFF